MPWYTDKKTILISNTLIIETRNNEMYDGEFVFFFKSTISFDSKCHFATL